MVKLLLDLLVFLRSCAPLLTSVIILTILCILLSKSIKKHSTIYYTVLAIPFVLVALPFILRMFGIEMITLTRIPFLGEIVRDYIHMGTFGHPLLIIIMYMGALDPKIKIVKKLLTIRKELSIISGFAVFTHSLIRVTNNFPNALKFFINNTEYMEKNNVASELGAGVSNFSFILGIIMLTIFIPLWITSFDSVHRRMGNARWKKLQKWSYVLYATLFIHAMGIQIGGMLNPRTGNTPKPAAIERTVIQGNPNQEYINASRSISAEELRERNTEIMKSTTDKNTDSNMHIKPKETGKRNEQVSKPSTSGRTPTKGFSDIKVSAKTKGWIHIFSLLLIYGSYLFLRLRKAKKDNEKRKKLLTVEN